MGTPDRDAGRFLYTGERWLEGVADGEVESEGVLE